MKIFFLVLLIAISLFGHKSTHAQCSTEVIVIKNGLVIDGVSEEPHHGWIVVLCEERISYAGPEYDIPQNAEIIDASGLSILPGLTDMHGHLYANTGRAIEPQRVYPSLYLAGGVTTIYSPGEYNMDSTMAFQKEISEGKLIGSDIYTAGPYFDHSPSVVGWIDGVNSIEELEEQFELWKGKVDGVKAYQSITESELKRLIELAHEIDLPVTGHLSSVSATRAIELGIDGIEHGIMSASELFSIDFEDDRVVCNNLGLDPENKTLKTLLDLVAQNQVYISPTVVIFAVGIPGEPEVTEDWREYLNPDALSLVSVMRARLENFPDYLSCMSEGIKTQLQFIQLVHKKGGLIVAGTDPVATWVTPGYGLHRELEYYVEAGLSPMEAIKTATINPAIALRKDSEFGSIEKGKLASLVLVEGDPSISISDIRNTVLVIKRGHQYNPDALKAFAIGKIGE